MKRLIVVLGILAIATITWALPAIPPIQRTPDDKGGIIYIQGHAPNGKKDLTLVPASQTVDMTNDISWAAYTTTDCFYRNMSTATKAGKLKTIPSYGWHQRVVNKITPFTNFSGCTGSLERN